MEQNPITFLSQEDPDNRLLVIIKNKDIAGHVHKVVNSCKVLTDSALIHTFCLMMTAPVVVKWSLLWCTVDISCFHSSSPGLVFFKTPGTAACE